MEELFLSTGTGRKLVISNCLKNHSLFNTLASNKFCVWYLLYHLNRTPVTSLKETWVQEKPRKLCVPYLNIQTKKLPWFTQHEN